MHHLSWYGAEYGAVQSVWCRASAVQECRRGWFRMVQGSCGAGRIVYRRVWCRVGVVQGSCGAGRMWFRRVWYRADVVQGGCGAVWCRREVVQCGVERGPGCGAGRMWCRQVWCSVVQGESGAEHGAEQDSGCGVQGEFGARHGAGCTWGAGRCGAVCVVQENVVQLHRAGGWCMRVWFRAVWYRTAFDLNKPNDHTGC